MKMAEPRALICPDGIANEVIWANLFMAEHG
jgi:hypothetical protein